MNVSPFLASGVAATNKVGVIVGAVIGALLLLLLLLLLIWLLCCCCRKRRYEKEVANEIRYSSEADAHMRGLPQLAGDKAPRVVSERTPRRQRAGLPAAIPA